MMSISDAQYDRLSEAYARLQRRVAQLEALIAASQPENERADLALQESAEGLRLAQQSARVGTWDWDLVNNTVKWSEGIYWLLGAEPGSMAPTYEHWMNQVHAEDRERVSASAFEAIQKGTNYEDEFRLTMLDGQIIWLASKGRVLRDAEGRPARFIGVNFDITERKAIEAALRASEAKFATAFNTSPTVLTITRLADGRFVEVNESFVRLTGYTRDDVMGKTPYDVDLWVNPAQRQAGLADLRDGQALREVECDFRMKDGSIRTCLIAGELISLNGERHVMTSLTDITERKQAETALRQSEERLRLATEAAQIFSWEYDAATRLTRYSDNVAQALGFALPANMNDVWALMHPEDRERVFADFRRGLAGEKLIRHECRFVDPASGETIWVLAQGSIVRDAEDKPVRVLGITQNINERKRAEAVLTEQARLLDLSSDAIIMRDASDRIVYWNRGAELMYGYSRDEVLGQVVFKLLKVRFPQPLEEIKAVLRREGHWEGELEQTRKDGSQITVLTRWILDRASGQDGKSASVLVINTDITARKKAEQALHENQDMLALTMRGGRIGAWWRDLDTNAVWWSRELEEIFGLAPGGFEGDEDGFYAFVLEEDRPAIARAVEKAIAEHTDYAIEFRFRHAGGSVGWMDGRGRATYANDGRPLRLYGIGIDITERKRAEMDARFLADLGQIFTSTVDAPALMWQVASATAEHLHVNRAGFATIDESKRQAIIHRDYGAGVSSLAGVYQLWWLGADMMNHLHAGRLLIIDDAQKDPRTMHVYSQVLEPSAVRSMVGVPLLRMGRCVAAFFVSQNQPHEWTTAEIDLLRTVSERAWLAVESARLQSETQALNATLEARVAERTEALNHSHEQLRQLSAHVARTREDERTRIAREVHDELGGALTVLKMSLAQVSKRAQPDAAVGARLEDMRAQIDALVQAVRRISYDLRPSMLDDFGLLAAMEWQAQEWEMRTGIQCEMVMAPDLQVDLSDRCRTAVFRAFQESLTNVARHSQATKVIVTVHVNDGLVLTVQDNGHGIDPEKITGSKSLGLAGMRERMRELGGDVEIASVAGEGVTVTLRVPLDQ